MAAVSAKHAAMLDFERHELIEDQRFGNDVIEFDHLAGYIEPAALAANGPDLVHGALEHGDLLGAAEFAARSHQAASIRPQAAMRATTRSSSSLKVSIASASSRI